MFSDGIERGQWHEAVDRGYVYLQTYNILNWYKSKRYSHFMV